MGRSAQPPTQGPALAERIGQHRRNLVPFHYLPNTADARPAGFVLCSEPGIEGHVELRRIAVSHGICMLTVGTWAPEHIGAMLGRFVAK